VITIKEIAERAELSIGTVDRVLHGRGRVSKKTEEKIRNIIRKTGYKTNILARNLSMQTTHQFGVIMPSPDQDGGYWDILKRGIDQAAGELSSFRVNRHYYFFDKYSDSSFVEAGKKSLDDKMGGLVIAPVLYNACTSFVKSIPNEIPYIYVDSTIPGTTPLMAIGQNSFQSGRCGAKLMNMSLTGVGEIAVLRMLPNDFHINERVRGFLSFFEGNQSVVVHVFDVNGSATEQELVDLILSIETRNPKCKGYFVTNAETHRIAKAIQATRRNGHRVIGYDCIEENKRLLELGAIDFIISQNTREQGYTGINMLFRHLVLKETPAAEISMPIDIVIAENLSCYQ
jgi:LacI family transcriptional regulator